MKWVLGVAAVLALLWWAPAKAGVQVHTITSEFPG
jgi:P pilus assembly chaperone PapD